MTAPADERCAEVCPAAAVTRAQLLRKLRQALDEVRILSGLLHICAACKKIHDDDGSWKQCEVYIRDHSEAEFSHGLCPGMRR